MPSKQGCQATMEATTMEGGVEEEAMTNAQEEGTAMVAEDVVEAEDPDLVEETKAGVTVEAGGTTTGSPTNLHLN